MNRELVNGFINILGTLTLGGQILLGVLLILLIQHFTSKNKKTLTNFVRENGVAFALIVASVATLGSLFLSEIAHFTPCKLCWWQRIFMYPLVLLLGIGFWRNDRKIYIYALPLAVIGFFIALYHYALQMYPGVLPCSDEVASCAAKQFAQFGYITIPMMALTAFALIITFLLFEVRKEKK